MIETSRLLDRLGKKINGIGVCCMTTVYFRNARKLHDDGRRVQRRCRRPSWINSVFPSRRNGL